MAKEKYKAWLTENKLLELQALAQTGLSDRQIAKEMHISTTTLFDWKRRYPQIEQALSAGRGSADIQVENALLRRALGYSYLETTYERVVDDETGEEKMVVKRQVEKQVLPDLSAQSFWLKNRTPQRWRDKQDTMWADRDITVMLMDDEDEKETGEKPGGSVDEH